MNETLAQGLAAIIQYLGATPVLLFFTIVIVGPLGSVVWVVYKLNRMLGKITADQEHRMQEVFTRQDQRFEQVVGMYRDNVQLVKDYKTHVDGWRDITHELQKLVILSTQTMTTLVEYIKNNLFCPLVKQRTKPDKIGE